MKFNPEDGQNTGPRCRNCHRGSSGCGGCHNTDPYSVNAGTDAQIVDNNRGSITELFAYMFNMIGQAPFHTGTPGDFSVVHEYTPYTDYNLLQTSTDETNTISEAIFSVSKNAVGQIKPSRTVEWSTNWRESTGITAAATCLDDGFSWPHRTLGWKMLKDDLFGLDFDGSAIAVGDDRTYNDGTSTSSVGPAHDVDSVCLDCHNPTIWNASSALDHDDDPNSDADNYDDDVLMRGLP